MAQQAPSIPFEDSGENILPHLNNSDKHYGFYQLCPKCEGEGRVIGFGDSPLLTRTCPICKGEGVIPRPEIKTQEP